MSVLNIGALNLALSLSGSTTAATTPAVNSVSTPDEINNLRISPQVIQNRVTGIAKENFEILQYPLDLRKFYMRIDFKRYQRPNPSDPATTFTNHAICLPIPTNLSDRFDLDYTDYDGGLAQQIVGSFTNENQGFTTAPLFAQLNKLSGAGKAFVNIAAQNLQVALNPLKSVMFNTPRFKQYQFSWTFAPNTEQESKALRQIIKKIKASILPTYVKSADPRKPDYNVFNYPYMAQIHFYPWANEAKSSPKNNEADMFQTKHGFIDNLTINYSPENNISFFDSTENSPTFVELTISFIEIELHTAEDYGRTEAPGEIERTTEDVTSEIELRINQARISDGTPQNSRSNPGESPPDPPIDAKPTPTDPDFNGIL